MPHQEELISIYGRYIQSCKVKYDTAELLNGIKEARLTNFAHALSIKAQQLQLYAQGIPSIAIDLFQQQLGKMAEQAIESLKDR